MAKPVEVEEANNRSRNWFDYQRSYESSEPWDKGVECPPVHLSDVATQDEKSVSKAGNLPPMSGDSTDSHFASTPCAYLTAAKPS